MESQEARTTVSQSSGLPTGATIIISWITLLLENSQKFRLIQKMGIYTLQDKSGVNSWGLTALRFKKIN
jgi:hypothetical protein